jgi:phosphinothricin acetyltransferase
MAIRLAIPEDAAQMAAIYRPSVEGSATSFELVAPDAAELERRRAAALQLAPWLVWDDGAVAGYAYASRHRDRAAYQWSVDVSVYVDQGRRRRGIAAGLYRSLFALLRLQGFCAAHAGIALPNAASVGLHESLGFRPIGVYPQVGYKLGAWRDVGWWQLPLGPRAAEPAPPLGLAEALRLPGWADALATGERVWRE